MKNKTLLIAEILEKLQDDFWLTQVCKLLGIDEGDNT